MRRASTAFALLCVLATAAIILGCRWFGPHDLYEKDQPKTMAYTADVLLHGRYALPRDMIYQPATKPPMYNWIDAAVIKLTGVWSEWTLKFPSVLGVIVTGGIVYAMARRAVAKRSDATAVGLLAVGIWFTFGSDVRHGSVLRLSYLARPDMLLTMFCTAAWACFTVAAERWDSRAAFQPAMAGWLCVAGATLTKGPAAALPAIFGVVYAVVRSTRPTPQARPGVRASWRWGHLIPYFSLGRSWPVLGIAFVALVGGAWLNVASLNDPTHVMNVILRAEVTGRLQQTPEGFRKEWYDSLMWFVTKTWPWGAVAVVALVLTAWLPRLRRTAGPAALYLLIVLIGLSLPAAKRMDYLLPAYAPAAVLIAIAVADVVRERVLGVALLVALPAVIGAVLLGQRVVPGDWAIPIGVLVAGVVACRVERRSTASLGVLALVPLTLGCVLARTHLRKSLEASNRWSDHAVEFVGEVRHRVPADAKLLVIVRGKHPLVTLLGRHQGSYLTPGDLAAADYVILPQQPDLPAELVSRPLPIGFDVVEDRRLTPLGLYRHVPLNRLVAMQQACADWTPTENPYHAPGTVFRDE